MADPTPEDVYRAAQRVRDLAFNALSRALATETRAFVSLIERERIADAVVTAIETEIRASAYAAGREAAAQAIGPTFTRAQIDRAVHFAECRNGKPRDWRYFTDLGDDEECDCGYYPVAEIARGGGRG